MIMFVIYHSNQPEFFKEILINIMSEEALSNPMQSEIILIENKIMIEWIQFELAQYFGIAANIKFMNVSAFMQTVSNKISPNNFIINDFYYSVIYWKFMEILPTVCSRQNFSIIKKYLCDDFNKRKCGQLAEQLVELFSRYLIYRADWLDTWQSNKMVHDITHSHQLWQAELWRVLLRSLKFIDKIFYENINYLANCVHLLKNFTIIDSNFFPNRIFIFGITSMPAIYWEIFSLLSNHIDIHLWLITPYSKFHCDDIFNKNLLNIESLCKFQIKNYHASKYFFSTVLNTHIVSDVINISIHDQLNHIFIDFCGLVGKKTLWLLTKLENLLEKKLFIIPREDSLLHILQKNILEWQDYIVLDQNKCNIKILKNDHRHLLKVEDQSITLHVCYSIYREIEVLHDNLLLMIQNDPLLLQKGIIVMAPSIFDYVGAINTIFNNIYGRNLPFIISCQYKKHIHPIASAFLNILNISYSRCTAEEILSFLNISLIAKRFKIREEEVKLLNQWVMESGIRWGLDDITMHNFNLPNINQNTWYFGLMRMLLGHAIHDEFVTWEGVAPYDGINTEYINIIGQLGEFLQILKKWRDRFNCSRTIIEWMPYMQEILDDFFQCSEANIEENKTFYLLKSYWKNILEPGIKSRYTDVINIVVLRDKLLHKLNQNTVHYQFLPNVINFCNITPICCIPCKIICFLGMSKDAFPRNKIFFDFDLIQKNPRSDDDSLYDKDCYHFLLAFLLAQERIYISFVEKFIDDCTSNNASILIDTLFEYIARHFYLIEDKHVDLNINMEHIRHHLQRRYNRVSFAAEHFVSGSKIQSFANEWVSSVNVCTHVNNNSMRHFNFLVPLSKIMINTISFDDLYNFYCHPIKLWFQKRLGIYFNKYISIKLKNNLNDYSFSPNVFHRFHLNTKLLNCLIYNKDTTALYNSICAAGILPHGVFGELYWIEQNSKMNILANQIKIFNFFKKFNLNISLTVKNVILTGQLNMLQKNGLVRWKAAYLSIKDGMLLWLEHLVYCSMGGIGDSRLFGINDMWHFPNLSSFQAKEFLFLLISGYLIGINVPLLLLYKSGGAWINQMFDKNTKSMSIDPSQKKKARYKLLCAWQGVRNSLIEGEYYDPYLRVFMPYDLSDKDIEEIIKIAKDYFLFPMKYRII